MPAIACLGFKVFFVTGGAGKSELELDDLVANHSVDWEWVKGHSGNPGNERADQLANKGIDDYLKKKIIKKNL